MKLHRTVRITQQREIKEKKKLIIFINDHSVNSALLQIFPAALYVQIFFLSSTFRCIYIYEGFFFLSSGNAILIAICWYKMQYFQTAIGGFREGGRRMEGIRCWRAETAPYCFFFFFFSCRLHGQKMLTWVKPNFFVNWQQTFNAYVSVSLWMLHI